MNKFISPQYPLEINLDYVVFSSYRSEIALTEVSHLTSPPDRSLVIYFVIKH